MSLYKFIIKPFVRNMDIKKASSVALKYFRLAGIIPGGRALSRLVHNNYASGLQKEVFGYNFNNPIGLGAGLDLYGELYNDLNALGFSFVEIGPLNAAGVRNAVRNIQNDRPQGILAACLEGDFLTSFTLAYDFCDFFVIDFTTDTNTDLIDPLLFARIPEQAYKPIVLKLPVTISNSELDEIIDYCLLNNVDGVESRNIEQVKHIYDYSKGLLPIIANSHIGTPEEAEIALEAGASLVEVRSGLVKEGPSFVSKILKLLLNKTKNEKTDSK